MAEFIINAVVFISLFSAVFYLLIVKKNSPLINLFGSFLIVGAVFEVVAVFSAGSESNIIYFHIYNIAAFVIISTFFLYLFNGSKYWMIGIVLSAITYLLIVYFQGNQENNFYSKNVLDLFIILTCLVSLFYLLIKTSPDENFLNLKFFIFGLLINFSGSFLIFLFFEALADISESSLKSVYFIRVLLNLIAQILFIISLVLSPRNKYFSK